LKFRANTIGSIAKPFFQNKIFNNMLNNLKKKGERKMKKIVINIAFVFLFLYTFIFANAVDIQSAPKEPKVINVNYLIYSLTLVFVDTDADGCYDYLFVFKGKDLIFDTPFVVVNPNPNDSTFIQNDSRVENFALEQCPAPSNRYYLYFDAYSADSAYIGSLHSSCNSDTALFILAGAPILLENSIEDKGLEGKSILFQKSKGGKLFIPDGVNDIVSKITFTNSVGKSIPINYLLKGKDGIEIDLNDIPCGLYLLQISNAQIVKGYKVIIY
jgi:hypothetical protein